MIITKGFQFFLSGEHSCMPLLDRSRSLALGLAPLQGTSEVFRSAGSSSNGKHSPKYHGIHEVEFPPFKLPPNLPPHSFYGIKNTEWLTSSKSINQLPEPTMPEVALIGQSNTGKSALINLITGNPSMARVSKLPGNTRKIQHYVIKTTRPFYMADLPGYGKAKVPLSVRREWHDLTKEYFMTRNNLMQIFLLVDASMTPMQMDLDAAAWMVETGRPWSIVFTKLDLFRQEHGFPQENMELFLANVKKHLGHDASYIATSSVSGLGRETMLQYISSLSKQFRMPLAFKV